MSKDFPFIEIPEHLREKIGIADPGTRLYRAYGTDEECSDWCDIVFEICHGDGCLSPGGAAGYVGVTRPGVHKKLKAGGLTGFVFHITKDSLFFKNKKVLSSAAFYCYIPRSECKAWKEELKKKRDDKEIENEVMGDGDFHDRYLDKPPKHLKKKLSEEQKKGSK